MMAARDTQRKTALVLLCIVAALAAAIVQVVRTRGGPAARPPLCRVAMIAPYPPRVCGIATFSETLACGIESTGLGRVDVLALEHWLLTEPTLGYSARVKMRIRSGLADDFRKAAAFVNARRYDLVILQHEWGILKAHGWEYVDILRTVRAPTVVIIHALHKNADNHERALLRALAANASALVTMSHTSWWDGVLAHGLPSDRLRVIPHGVATWPAMTELRGRRGVAKRKLGMEADRPLLLTQGLIHTHKGIHRMINAMPEILAAFPDATYLVLGRQSPGESDRNVQLELMDLAATLPNPNAVMFEPTFVSERMLRLYLEAADVAVLPYDDHTPTSGTLLAAMGAGRPVVATSFAFARESLAEGRGLVVPPDDPQQLSAAVLSVLRNATFAATLGSRAHAHVRNNAWPRVGLRYLCLAAMWKPVAPALERACAHLDEATEPVPFLRPLSNEAMERMAAFDDVAIDPLSGAVSTSVPVPANLCVLVDYDVQLVARVTSSRVEQATLTLPGEGTMVIPSRGPAQWNGRPLPSGHHMFGSVAAVVHQQGREGGGGTTLTVQIPDRYRIHLRVIRDDEGGGEGHVWQGVSVLTGHTRPRGILAPALQCLLAGGRFVRDGDRSVCHCPGLESTAATSVVAPCGDAVAVWGSARLDATRFVQAQTSAVCPDATFDPPAEWSLLAAAPPPRSPPPRWPLRVVMEGPFWRQEGMSTVNRAVACGLLRANWDVTLIATEHERDAVPEIFTVARSGSGGADSAANDQTVRCLTALWQRVIQQGPVSRPVYSCDVDAGSGVATCERYGAADGRLEMDGDRVRLGDDDTPDTVPLSGPNDVDATIRNAWPPNWNPPASGAWIQIQPWEFGSVPSAWVRTIEWFVDDLWVPSRFVRDCYVDSGVSPDKVFVMSHGVDTIFHPSAPPRALPKRCADQAFRFLFVGTLIPRKGLDILIDAYRMAFGQDDSVCLYIHALGKYGTVGDIVQDAANDPNGPVVMLAEDDYVPEAELPGLFTAFDCLVHPARGEGFALPVAEAMAAGVPVIVTGGGAPLEYCDNDTCWLIPARRVDCTAAPCGDRSVFEIPTTAQPWWYEMDPVQLAALMQTVRSHPEDRRAKARRARARIVSEFSWDIVTELAAARLQYVIDRKTQRSV